MLSIHLIGQYLCKTPNTLVLPFQPSLSTHRFPAPLHVDGDVIYSNEGTTQGDPLAMPFYALSTIPLLHKLPNNVIHAWYADDASTCGQISHLRLWWNHHLDHLLATSLVPPRLGLLSRTVLETCSNAVC